MKTFKNLTFFLLFCNINSLFAQTCVTENEIPSSTPDSRFVVNADGTVLDKVTNLMWMRCSLGQSGNDCSMGTATEMNWKDALLSVNGYSFAGHSDWRVPTVKELFTLVEQRCYNPSINITIFPATTQQYYWTSSPDVGVAGNAWSIPPYGEAFRNDQSSLYNVRLVRNP